MICQNCHSEVDNDLVFCTNCGARLHEAVSQIRHVLPEDPVATKVSAISSSPQKSNLKWIALIVVLIIVPSSLFVGYLLLKPESQQTTQNVSQPKTPVSSPTNNQNTSSSIIDSNLDPANSNSEKNVQTTDASTNSEKTNLWGERVGISPNSNYAVPFKIEEKSAKVAGDIRLVQGEPIVGYVFLKEVYEEHYVDPNYKVFDFNVAKDSSIEQTLPGSDYVLIFVNQTQKSATIQGSIFKTTSPNE
jgi:hypothetical protein